MYKKPLSENEKYTYRMIKEYEALTPEEYEKRKLEALAQVPEAFDDDRKSGAACAEFILLFFSVLDRIREAPEKGETEKALIERIMAEINRESKAE